MANRFKLPRTLAQTALDAGALFAAFALAAGSSLRAPASWVALALSLAVTSLVRRILVLLAGREDGVALTLPLSLAAGATVSAVLGLLGLAWPASALPAVAIGAVFAPLAFLARLAAPVPRAAAHTQVLVVGTGPLGVATAGHLAERGIEVVGHLSLPGEPVPAALANAHLGAAGDLTEVLARFPVDEVYLAARPEKQGRILSEVLATCETLGQPFAVPALPLERARPAHPRAAADGYLHYRFETPLSVQRVLKRAVDVVGSAAALLLLSPLLATAALAVKLTSPGPVLFRQVRLGQHGRPFAMLKFRSMVQNAEALRASLAALNEQDGPVFKIRNDPRLTPVGRFLRKYSIDELPQLLNVLRGQMSLVGPRPPLPHEVATYEPWQRRRLSVRPGLTCLWQVSGRNEVSFEQWMYMDLHYIDHWSLRWDLRLLLKTVPVVLTGKGAS